jgi:hypothetical protein
MRLSTRTSTEASGRYGNGYRYGRATSGHRYDEYEGRYGNEEGYYGRRTSGRRYGEDEDRYGYGRETGYNGSHYSRQFQI